MSWPIWIPCSLYAWYAPTNGYSLDLSAYVIHPPGKAQSALSHMLIKQCHVYANIKNDVNHYLSFWCFTSLPSSSLKIPIMSCKSRPLTPKINSLDLFYYAKRPIYPLNKAVLFCSSFSTPSSLYKGCILAQNYPFFYTRYLAPNLQQLEQNKQKL